MLIRLINGDIRFNLYTAENAYGLSGILDTLEEEQYIIFIQHYILAVCIVELHYNWLFREISEGNCVSVNNIPIVMLLAFTSKNMQSLCTFILQLFNMMYCI